MIRLRISRKLLRALTWTVLTLAVVAGLYGIGVAVTPRDSAGRPLVFSPSLRAAERYRAQTRRWAERMAQIDRGLSALLATDLTADVTEVYAQGEQMQRLGEEAVGLASEVQASQSPVALVGLRELARQAAQSYVEAAVQTARWLAAPSEGRRNAALSVLVQARAARAALEESRWLSTD